MPTELDGFEGSLQRAGGVGLCAFALQAVAVALAGWPLYPLWWFLGPAPVVLAATTALAVACLRGRSRPAGRIVVVAVCAACSVLTALATAASVHEVGNATLPLVTALITLLGFLDHPVVALPVGTTLVAVQMIGVAVTRPLDPADVVVVGFIQVAILLAAAAGGRLARRAAAEQDLAHARLSRAIVADRAAAASRSDRREQERELHDTVLSTLTALARSSLSSSDRLRARCAADADYLRSLRRHDDVAPAAGDPASLDLHSALHAMARALSRPRLRVRVAAQGSAVPLTGQVVRAIGRAAREAITNSARHSGAAVIEIELRWSAAQVTVAVADDGCGIPPSGAQGGLGVRRSIVERMADVGGRGTVQHEAGAGTRVVLTWPG